MSLHSGEKEGGTEKQVPLYEQQLVYGWLFFVCDQETSEGGTYRIIAVSVAHAWELMD